MYAFWLGKKPALIYGRPCGKPGRICAERNAISGKAAVAAADFRGKGREPAMGAGGLRFFFPTETFVAIPEAFALTVAGSV